MDQTWLEGVMLKKEFNEKIIKVLDAKFESAVPKGQNYTSRIISAELTVMLGSGRRAKRNLIIKELIDGSKGFSDEFCWFKTEIMIYSHVLPQMENLMLEFEDKSDRIWGSFLGYKPYNVVVFEDLRAKNFTVAERSKCLDWDHSVLVLQNLGKYHAMSKILLDRGLIGEDDFKPFFVTLGDRPFFRNLFVNGLLVLGGVIKSTWPNKWKALGEKLEAEADLVVQKLRKLGEKTEDTFIVANHGDSWTCNMMFKYSPDKKPIAHKLLDFQVSHAGSYIWDVMYFLHTSVKAEIRRRKLDQLLDVYHKALSSSLGFFGYRGRAPTFGDVQAEAERVRYFAFVMLAVIFPLTTASRNDAFSMEAVGTQGEAKGGGVNEEVLKTESYISDTAEDFKSFVDNGII